MTPRAAFYFDLASPDAYLAAERLLHVLPGPAEWQPVLARRLTAPANSGARTADEGSRGPHPLPSAEGDPELRERIAARARHLGLQPLRWPDPFPFDSSLAMHVATYAKSIGRLVPFAQAAFRQAFAGGHSLDVPDHVLIAAAACEMHPTAVLRGAELRSVDRQLNEATDHAARTGIIDVPALLIDDRLFIGEGSIEDAAAHMLGTS